MARSANNLNAVLQDTADAIKAKKSSSAKICPRDFADEIAGISTGITPTGDVDLRYPFTITDVSNKASAYTDIRYLPDYAPSRAGVDGFDHEHRDMIALQNGVTSYIIPHSSSYFHTHSSEYFSTNVYYEFYNHDYITTLTLDKTINNPTIEAECLGTIYVDDENGEINSVSYGGCLFPSGSGSDPSLLLDICYTGLSGIDFWISSKLFVWISTNSGNPLSRALWDEWCSNHNVQVYDMFGHRIAMGYLGRFKFIGDIEEGSSNSNDEYSY